MASRLAVIVARRSTLRLLISRDLKVKYADSVLGYLWSVLDPLLMAFVYWFVFTKIFRRTVGAEPYILFLMVGLLPWQWAQGVIQDSPKALTAEAKLVRSTNLSREIWVLRKVGSKYVEFVLSLPVLLLFALLYRDEVTFSWHLLLIPVAMVLQAIMLTGIGLILAPLTVLFKDIERLIRVVLRILFYLSPVIYGVRNVPDAVRPFFGLNPLSGILDLYRAGFFPEEFAGWHTVGLSIGVTALLWVAGWRVFATLESAVLKEI